VPPVGSLIRDLGLWRSGLAVRAYRLLRRVASRLGLQVLVKSFYSPVPDIYELPPAVWERRSELRGVDFDLERHAEFIESELAPYFQEFDPPEEETGRPFEYHARNPSFSRMDAQVLYALVRRNRPSQVLELGSGFSTLVLARASRENAAHGIETRLEAFDPYPNVVSDELPGLHSLHRVKAEDVDVGRFEALQSGDMLVVDSTHTVKLGSDVNFAVLDVLPLLQPGVWAHFHDIYLPWEYPRYMLEDFGLFWNEQYLLQAFLAQNSEWETVAALYAVARTFPDRMAGLAPAWAGHAGVGLWMRRRDA
jgi:Methyltransferase domain